MIETKSNTQTTNFIKYLTITITISIIIFIIYAFKLGIFQNKNILINYIKETGIIAPIIFFFFITIVTEILQRYYKTEWKVMQM